MANPAADFPLSIHSPIDVPAFADAEHTLGGSTPTQTDLAGKIEAEIVATQQKLGSGSSTPVADKLLIGTGVGTSGWTKTSPTGEIVGTTDTQTLENKTLTAPVINNPTGFLSGASKITVGSSAPASPSVGDIWIDTT